MSQRVARRERPRVALVITASLVVCSLLSGAIGTVVIDGVLEQGDDDDAQELAENADDEFVLSLRATAEAEPADPLAMVSLASLLAQTGKLDEAIDWYERALALDPSNRTARLDFARSLSDGGKRPDAEVQFRRVLETAPDDAEAHFYLAELYRNWAPPRAAEAANGYRRVLALLPDSFFAQRANEALAALGQPSGSPVATPPVVEATP